MATKPKFTHYRARADSVSLAGKLLRKGQVVAIAEIETDDLPESYLPTIEKRIVETGNTWKVLEAGTMKDGEFVPLELQTPKEPAKTPDKEPESEDGQE